MGKVSAVCADYYRQTLRLEKLSDKMFVMREKEIPYTGQSKAFELDAIVESHIQSIEAYNKALNAEVEWHAAKWEVIEMLHDFGVPHNTRITVTIPHELEFEIWVHDEKTVHFEKTADLSSEEDEDIIILSGKRSSILDDDNEDEEPGKKLFIYTRRTAENDEYFTKKSKVDVEDED